MTRWQILTGEYPPQPGGVSDYTRVVARALAAAGDGVVVWAPPCGLPEELDPGVSVRRLPDRFGPRSLRVLARSLDALPEPRRLLVQYVPHAFGWKAANVPFCLWLRSRRRDSVWVVFHEVAFPFGRRFGASGNALGAITRWMAAIVGRVAERSFVSIPAWRPMVESLAGAAGRVTWLPVPSSIPKVHDPAGVALVRLQVAPARPLVGHLGTYGSLIRPMLDDCLPVLVAATQCQVLLLGRGGDAMRDDLTTKHPALGSRIHATGEVAPDELSRHVSACDVMLQPYPDGVSSRRTSVMVALSHARPVVTTRGSLTEPLWASSDAVVLVPAGDPAALAAETARLIAEPSRWVPLSAGAEAMYAERFDLSHTISALRAPDAGRAGATSRR